jgi:hypothetical protein
MAFEAAIVVGLTGLGLAALLWRLFNPRTRLEIGDRGILDRRLGWGWIPWEEIEGAYPPTLDRAETVRLKVRVTDRLSRVLPRAAPSAGSVEVSLDLSGTEFDPVEVLQEILDRRTGTHPGAPPELAPPGSDRARAR